MQVVLFLIGLFAFVVGVCDAHWAYANWWPGPIFYAVFAVLNIGLGIYNMDMATH